ncbi:AAA family ATPase [Photorhabdus khanii]|uniref:AAA family ATPase n=1 Tax=Photorhabdus khanii TaxID=1004150 RepID=A0A7C9GK53_9GAMM|nr:AAA family ATPase [Photorhabdus khanii]MQL49113.1 AAA family ATPase [Photorhabdus khanii]
MNSKPGSAINRLINKTKKNDFYAAYQLYEYYSKGTYVDKDLNEAKNYLSLAKSIFKDQDIKLTEVNIMNFRVFNNISFKIKNKNLTVIVGNNGAGKTSILDAIVMSISWIINRILYSGGKGKEIENIDITLGSDDGYSSILTKFSLNKNIKANLELVTVHEGSFANKKSMYVDVNRLGNLYKIISSDDGGFNLPIFAYYSVLRSSDINSKDVGAFDEISSITETSRFDGYINSLNGKADFKSFFKWFKRIDDIEKHRTIEKRDNSKVIDKDLMKKLEKLAESSEEAKNLIKNLKINSDLSLPTHDINEITKIKSTINKVINSFMDGYGNISIEVEPYLLLTIEKNGKKLNVLQLSQGEKSLLALVLDIARRLILLNPTLNNPLDGKGIILIDEFDLHLHPEWQRQTIRQLTKVFKNCQFIISTHSPQIISEVKNSQLIILEQDETGRINNFTPEQSYGLTSNDILNEIMLKNSKERQLIRNPEVEKKLHEIYNLISDKKFVDAKSKIKNLEKELNGEIPELVSAKIDIDLYGWDD